jgi:hypothetical protein
MEHTCIRDLPGHVIITLCSDWWFFGVGDDDIDHPLHWSSLGLTTIVGGCGLVGASGSRDDVALPGLVLADHVMTQPGSVVVCIC